MDVNEISILIELIGTMGICGVLCFVQVIINKKNLDTYLDKLDKWTEIVTNNTVAINKLAERIGFLEDLSMTRKD